jgi:hypothetical protein
MKMVSHEAKGVNLKVPLLTGFTESFEKELPIAIISHDAVTMIASAHDVIDSARIFYTELASHDRTVSSSPATCRYY